MREKGREVSATGKMGTANNHIEQERGPFEKETQGECGGGVGSNVKEKKGGRWKRAADTDSFERRKRVRPRPGASRYSIKIAQRKEGTLTKRLRPSPKKNVKKTQGRCFGGKKGWNVKRGGGK